MPERGCPKCDAVIDVADINMAEGVALCTQCGALSRLSELVEHESSAELADAASGTPPEGCRVNNLGDRVELVASARGGHGCFFVVFAAFWNSITSVFVFMLLASAYKHMGGTLPAWLQSVKGNASPATMSVGMTVILGVFLLPFVLIGAGTLFLALVGVAGRYVVTLRGDEGTISLGVGPVAWRRRFDAGAVTSVRVGPGNVTSSSGRGGRSSRHTPEEAMNAIHLEGGPKSRVFGHFLRDDRRKWLAGVLRAMLVGTARRR